jgi:PAS domain-containing protein
MTSRVFIASQTSGVEDSAALLERLFQAAPLAIQIYGADGRCLLANTASYRMFGDDSTRSYNAFADDAPGRRSLRDAIQRAFSGETVRISVDNRDSLWPGAILTGEGSESAVEATAFPLFDGEGAVRQVALCFEFAPLDRGRRSEQLRIDGERQKSN